MKRAYGSRRRSPKKFIIAALILVAGVFGWSALNNHPKVLAGQTPHTPAERNAVREASVKLMAEAIHNYIAEVGPVPVKLPSVVTGICSASSAVCKKGGTFDMAFLTSQGYLDSVPNDPSGGPGMYTSGYSIVRNLNGQIIISAPRAEAGATISETVR